MWVMRNYHPIYKKKKKKYIQCSMTLDTNINRICKRTSNHNNNRARNRNRNSNCNDNRNHNQNPDYAMVSQDRIAFQMHTHI